MRQADTGRGGGAGQNVRTHFSPRVRAPTWPGVPPSSLCPGHLALVQSLDPCPLPSPSLDPSGKRGLGGASLLRPSKGCPSWQSLRRTGTVLPQGLCTCCFLRPEGSFLRHLHDSIPRSLHIFGHIPSESFPDLPGLGSDPSSSGFAFFPRSMRLGHRAMFILPTFCLPPPGREHHLARTCKDFVYFF